MTKVKKDNNVLLNELREKMLRDDELPLKDGATNLVFGDGNPEAEIVFIGEGPGRWEDEKGLPFVGNSGKLLNQLLESINLPREEVYITNVVHYRPPNNRDPLPEELAAFRPYLNKIVSIIEPKMIVTLGRFSMGKFFPGVTIGTIHGKPREIKWRTNKIVVVPMYHPAAGLRNGEFKKRLVEDFKVIPRILDELRSKQEEVENDVEQMELV